MHANCRTVVVVGPVGSRPAGVTLNANILIQRLKRFATVVIGETGPATPKNQPLRFHTSRLLRNFITAFKILHNGLFRSGSKCCIFVDGGYGQIYTLMHVAMARLSGQDLVLRHHSFEYVVRTRTVFRLIAALAGRRAVHTTLCKCMDEQIRRRYSSVARTLVVSNASLTPPVDEVFDRPSHPDEVVIGFLSNLTKEKGLFEVLALSQLVRREGLNARFVLAGTLDRSHEREAVELAALRDPDLVSYVGPVYGAEKTEFFSSLDIFVFPTQYRMEAQPNVIFEALASSCRVVSIDIACIGSDIDPDSGTAASSVDDFFNSAVAEIRRFADATLAERRQIRGSVLTAYRRKYAESSTQYQQLLQMLTDVGPRT